jgi:hypothetical protein
MSETVTVQCTNCLARFDGEVNVLPAAGSREPVISLHPCPRCNGVFRQIVWDEPASTVTTERNAP